MVLSDFSFTLPPERIAQEPLKDRTASKMLVVDKLTNTHTDSHIRNIARFLRQGDVLVFNDSKVIPARLYAKKMTGGKVELLLVSNIHNDVHTSTWEVMIGGHHMKNGMRLTLMPENYGVECQLIKPLSERTWKVQFSHFTGSFIEVLEHIGSTPIPPYITSSLSEKDLRTRYQTVYAQQEGSVAAPTAGLHFTQELLERLRTQGIQTTTITLHVGLGTFMPMREQDISKHIMHAEHASISHEAATMINAAKSEGRRIIAIGTTSVRTLESFAHNGRVEAGSKWTQIFIQPGYQFQIIDGMLTNFHLPESTLLVLVSAFAGRNNMLNAYQHAIKSQYRFYSFGDAMLII